MYWSTLEPEVKTVPLESEGGCVDFVYASRRGGGLSFGMRFARGQRDMAVSLST